MTPNTLQGSLLPCVRVTPNTIVSLWERVLEREMGMGTGAREGKGILCFRLLVLSRVKRYFEIREKGRELEVGRRCEWRGISKEMNKD